MKIEKHPIDKFLMHLCPKDGGISQALIRAGAREKVFMRLIRENIKEGDTCLDLGANIGYATLFMADRCGESGKIYAVEPDPHNTNLLKLNIEENNYTDRCEITQCLISDTNEEQDFWIASAPNLNSVQKTSRSTKKITVPSYTLSSFMKDKRPLNFIKMDVEGHEVNILDAGLDYFADQSAPINILLEVHPQFYSSDNSLEDVFKKYFAAGFSVKYVVSTPIPQPKPFKEASYTPIDSVKTDGFVRGLYNNISNDDALRFACHENHYHGSKKIVRSLMISR